MREGGGMGGHWGWEFGWVEGVDGPGGGFHAGQLIGDKVGLGRDNCRRLGLVAHQDWVGICATQNGILWSKIKE